MRWSGLKRDIENIFSEELNLQIYCTAYTYTNKTYSLSAPRYWITIGKELIWDFPGPFLEWKNKDQDSAVEYLDSETGTIAETLRAYLACGRNELMDFTFPKDRFGLVDILRAADRRLGKSKLLKKYGALSENSVVKKILEKRFELGKY